MNHVGVRNASACRAGVDCDYSDVGIVMARSSFFLVVRGHREVVSKINAVLLAQCSTACIQPARRFAEALVWFRCFLLIEGVRLYIAWRTDSFCDGTESACVLLRDPK